MHPFDAYSQTVKCRNGSLRVFMLCRMRKTWAKCVPQFDDLILLLIESYNGLADG